MKAKDVKLWYASVALLIVSVFPFFWFMYDPEIPTVLISLASLAVATVLYVIATKRITHPKDKYTALQAMKFAEKCEQAGFTNGKSCAADKGKFAGVAAEFDFAANLKYMQLLEMFKTGQQLNSELKGRK